MIGECEPLPTPKPRCFVTSVSLTQQDEYIVQVLREEYGINISALCRKAIRDRYMQERKR